MQADAAKPGTSTSRPRYTRSDLDPESPRFVAFLTAVASGCGQMPNAGSGVDAALTQLIAKLAFPAWLPSLCAVQASLKPEPRAGATQARLPRLRRTPTSTSGRTKAMSATLAAMLVEQGKLS
jgi:hypothetical protein